MDQIIEFFCEVCGIGVGKKRISNTIQGRKRTHTMLYRGIYQRGKSVKYEGRTASFCSKNCLNKHYDDLN